MAEEKNAFANVDEKGDDSDLSSAIANTVPRKAREQVTWKRITKSHYRCNWWTLQDTAGYDNPGMQGLTVTTRRISQSQFLHVTKGTDGLTIRVVSGGGSSLHPSAP